MQIVCEGVNFLSNFKLSVHVNLDIYSYLVIPCYKNKNSCCFFQAYPVCTQDMPILCVHRICLKKITKSKQRLQLLLQTVRIKAPNYSFFKRFQLLATTPCEVCNQTILCI